MLQRELEPRSFRQDESCLVYKFEAMDATGAEVKDSIEATSEEEAQQKIKQMGYFVTKITESAGGKKGGKKRRDTASARKVSR